MKLLPTQGRLLFAALIIFAFFIPSFNGVSGFRFVLQAFAEANGEGELTITDAIIFIIPLLSIPLAGLIILFRSIAELPTRKSFIYLPLLLMGFFFCMLYFNQRFQSYYPGVTGLLKRMQPGCYIGMVSAACLAFTKDFRKKRVRRKKSFIIPDTESSPVEASASS